MIDEKVLWKKINQKNPQTAGPSMDLHCYYFPHPTTPFFVLHLHVIQSPFVAFIMLQFHCFVYMSVISTSHWVRKSWIQLSSLSSPLYSQHLEYWLTQRRGQALFVNSVTRWWQWWWPGIREEIVMSLQVLCFVWCFTKSSEKWERPH